MEAPVIAALETEDALVLHDEFLWGAHGGSPVKWRILDCSDQGLTAISVSTVQERAYSDDVQGWLDAFAGDELGGMADSVFLLSIEEAAGLFPTDAARAAEGDNRNWWLTDAGGSEGFQAYVHSNGWINEYGAEAASTYAAVRPAIRLDAKQIQLDFGASSEDGEPVCECAEAFLGASNVMLASEYGEELLLEALEQEDVFVLEEFVARFGVHESWETAMVDALNQLSAEGDSLKVTRLLDMCGAIEYMTSALAEAVLRGHVAMAGTLLRAGASFVGNTKRSGLVGDTPELRQARKGDYPDPAVLCDEVVASEEGFYAIGSLVRQGLLTGVNYHALLRAAGRNPDAQDLFEWMLCPDHEPAGKMCAYLSKKRICVLDHPQANTFPVSQWALQMMWYPGLIQDNPEAVHAMARYLTDSKMEGRRELICFLAQTGTQQELQSLLARKRVFSPKAIAAAIEAAESAGKTRNADFLSDFLRSVGAGKLLQKDE